MLETAPDSDPAHDSEIEPQRANRPWWLPHFTGRIPIGIEDKHIALVGIVALAAFFENYDMSMLTSALKQIRESFGLTQSGAASLFAWIRLGAIPAFLVLPLADRIGRRKVFLVAIVGMSIGTLLTAFAGTAIQFVAAQTITRTFLVAATACAAGQPRSAGRRRAAGEVRRRAPAPAAYLDHTSRVGRGARARAR